MSGNASTRALLCLLPLIVALVAVPAAPARTWTARVVDVNDGDTIDVDIDGDGSRRVEAIRVIGVQAMEENKTNPFKHTPECHAQSAANRMSQLIRQGHRRVQLGAVGGGRRDERGRLLRTVATRVGGRWRDVGVKLIREGHGLWMPTVLAPWTNAPYNRAEQLARRDGRRL